jgi:hypothetical protein
MSFQNIATFLVLKGTLDKLRIMTEQIRKYLS